MFGRTADEAEDHPNGDELDDGSSVLTSPRDPASPGRTWASRRPASWVDGSMVIRTGRHRLPADAYHFLMEMSWSAFWISAAGAFILFNLAFATIYLVLPASISNMQAGSLADAFFFSAETLSTVGYGNMSPASIDANFVAAAEMFVGLFFSASLTGLVFARFSRPRDMFDCSHVATLAEDEDGWSVTVRLMPMRNHAIIDAVARLYLVERRRVDGGEVTRRLVELPFANGHAALVPLCWSLQHRVEPGSTFLSAYRRGDVELVLRVDGSYPFLAASAAASHIYRQADIREGHRFVEILTEHGSRLILNTDKLNATMASPAARSRPAAASHGQSRDDDGLPT